MNFTILFNPFNGLSNVSISTLYIDSTILIGLSGRLSILLPDLKWFRLSLNVQYHNGDEFFCLFRHAAEEHRRRLLIRLSSCQHALAGIDKVRFWYVTWSLLASTYFQIWWEFMQQITVSWVQNFDQIDIWRNSLYTVFKPFRWNLYQIYAFMKTTMWNTLIFTDISFL